MRGSAGVVLAFMAMGVSVLAASEATGGKATNVRVTVEVGRLEGGKKSAPKTYEMLAPVSGPTSLVVGSRIPIPSTVSSDGSEGEHSAPVTSFTYQNVGTTASFERVGVQEGKIFLNGEIEVSIVRNESDVNAGKAQPIISQFSEKISVVLADGKMTRVALVDEPGSGGAFFVDLKASLTD